jgi:hypothetical protein
MPTFQKILSAKHIEFPEYSKVYHISQLGNFIDYRRKNLEEDAKFRLECLIKELDENGMTHPILLSPTIAYSVSVGHQRVWYAKQKGYTHIDCYEVPNQAAWEKVFLYTNSNDYWQKYSHSEKCKLPS